MIIPRVIAQYYLDSKTTHNSTTCCRWRSYRGRTKHRHKAGEHRTCLLHQHGNSLQIASSVSVLQPRREVDNGGPYWSPQPHHQRQNSRAICEARHGGPARAAQKGKETLLCGNGRCLKEGVFADIVPSMHGGALACGWMLTPTRSESYHAFVGRFFTTHLSVCVSRCGVRVRSTCRSSSRCGNTVVGGCRLQSTVCDVKLWCVFGLCLALISRKTIMWRKFWICFMLRFLRHVEVVFLCRILSFCCFFGRLLHEGMRAVQPPRAWANEPRHEESMC